MRVKVIQNMFDGLKTNFSLCLLTNLCPITFISHFPLHCWGLKYFFAVFFSLDQTALGPISIRNIFRSFSLKNWFLEYGNLHKIYWKIARFFVFEKMRFSNSSFFAGFKLMGAPFRPYKFSLISLICQNSSNNANIFICILSILLQLISPLFNKVAWDFKQKWT